MVVSQEQIAFRSAPDVVAAVEPRVAAIEDELASQRRQLKVIASENYASPPSCWPWATGFRTNMPKVFPDDGCTPAVNTSMRSSASPPSTPWLSSAPTTPTSSRTRASTPTHLYPQVQL
jgi:hypothetical protein